MIRLSKKRRLFAVSLSFIAGFVDALGFIYLGGFFVSFMSGNSTRMAVSLSERLSGGLLPISIMSLFLLGVVGGTLLSMRSKENHGSHMLIALAGLFALSAAFAATDHQLLAILMTPVAMGAMNTFFQREGEVSVGVTYMTGTLVKLGQHVAIALTGGPRWSWAPYLMLWSGLASGAICGALVFPHLELQALWLPALALLGLGIAHDRVLRLRKSSPPVENVRET